MYSEYGRVCYTGRYELIVIWANGDKDIYAYKTEAQAERAEKGMIMANGNQIQWTGIRKQIVK